jgi:mannose-1-phosphate guanylyltransferase
MATTPVQGDIGQPFYPVIMAGGSGERFWPLSTSERPKQFLDLERSGRSLLQATFDRLRPLLPSVEHLYVLAAERYAGLVREHLPEIPEANLLLEPVARDTAPAVALAALELEARHGQVILGLFPADHRVSDEEAFRVALRRALWQTQETGGILTLGVKPTYPATGYGYIQVGEGLRGGAYRVARFVEKPDEARAAEYLAAGSYYWNSGIYLCHAQTILEELARFAPAILTPLRQAHRQGRIAEIFADLPGISIDYAVMERTQRAYVLPSEFGWDDLGSWLALERLYRKTLANTLFGEHEGLDSYGNIVYTSHADDLIVTLGVQDLVIVKRGGVVLVADKLRVQEIKKLMPALAKRKLSFSD